MSANSIFDQIESNVQTYARDIQQSPAANQAPASKIVVKRGPQLMVVFSGRPQAADVKQLLQTKVKVGLALSPSELTKVDGLDDYSYVFTGFGRQGSAPLKQAVADLAHNGWEIDDDGCSTPDLVEPRVPSRPVTLTMIHA